MCSKYTLWAGKQFKTYCKLPTSKKMVSFAWLFCELVIWNLRLHRFRFNLPRKGWKHTLVARVDQADRADGWSCTTRGCLNVSIMYLPMSNHQQLSPDWTRLKLTWLNQAQGSYAPKYIGRSRGSGQCEEAAGDAPGVRVTRYCRVSRLSFIVYRLSFLLLKNPNSQGFPNLQTCTRRRRVTPTVRMKCQRTICIYVYIYVHIYIYMCVCICI